MNALRGSVVDWPQMPPVPPRGQPVLLRVKTSMPRQRARQEVRHALTRVIAAWSGLSSDAIPLSETPRGPEWHGRLAGDSVAASLTYGDSDAWIGLLRGGVIGVDAMTVRDFPDMELVAPLYLGPVAWHCIRRSRDPARAFALAWTDLEARLKCLQQPLTEWRVSQDRSLTTGLDARRYVDGQCVVTVVTGPSRPSGVAVLARARSSSVATMHRRGQSCSAACSAGSLSHASPAVSPSSRNDR